MSHFQPWPWPRVLAHRGAGSLAPENTLAALRIGFEHGYRAVEFDAMAPLDDVAVLMHDPTLERTTGVSGAVTARRADELVQLDAGRWFSAAFIREPVPSLDRALQFCRSHGIWPNVEIKPAPGHEARTGAIVAQGVARAYSDALKEHGDRANLLDVRVPLLSSFAEDALVTARAAARDVPRALLIDQLPADWAAHLERLGAVCVNTNHEYLTRDAVRAVKQAGYWLFCYTVNDTERARELMALGVDAFCTDRIDRIGADFA